MNESDRKELPVIDWNNIAPPYNWYKSFSGVGEYPFHYRATMFDLVNAWWLIEAATLSYAEKDFAEGEFKKAGFTEVEYFSGKSTQCYVVSNKDFIVLAFRGTESRKRDAYGGYKDIVADLKADIDIKLVDSGQGGKVHKGFKCALEEVWEEVVAYLNEIHTGDRTFWITGHSLGATLATLAADRYGDVQGLYTFGSPLVGDSEFKKDFFVNTYRFVNNNDIVTKVPPPGFYQHVGELRYIDKSGKIHDNISYWERLADGFQGEMKNVFNSLGQLRHGFLRMIPDGLKDHVPLFYAVHIWNSLVDVS